MPNCRELPVYAWKLDNNPKIHEDELLIKVTKLHLENGNFNQICSEVGGDEEKIKTTVIEIVKQRGKMHNPYTGTGGLCAGTVIKIGNNFEDNAGVNIGDEVLVPVSVAMLPLMLEKVKKVNYIYNDLDVEGYAVIYSGCPIIKRTPEISWDLLLSAFEESASIKKASDLAEGKKNLLVIGSNLIVAMLYGFAVKKVMDPDGALICALYEDRMPFTSYDAKNQEKQSLCSVFDEVHLMDFKGMSEMGDFIEKAKLKERGFFDVIVNCADQAGAEAISVILAKHGGNVLFSNLNNNYTRALLIQEAIDRDMNLICAVGYTEGYYEYTLQLVRTIETELNGLSELSEFSELSSKFNYRQSDSLKRKRVFEHDDKRHEIERLLNIKSSAMRSITVEVERAAKYDCSVILEGESGVGKEVIANLIHRMSERKTDPFVKVNCAAIPKELMESEFFGYERGAFTGAKEEGKRGFFELSDHGILLLDEVSEMPLELQAKLLRVIQEGEFYRIGGQKPVKVDVRIFVSTNKNIEKLVREKKFRGDLYYRLNVLKITIPPLRERPEDIIFLADFFVEKYNQKYGLGKSITDEAKHCLLAYNWPGNVRELENTVQRLMICSDDDDITSGYVMREYNIWDMCELETGGEEGSFNEKVAAFEKGLIQAALKNYKSTYKAAKALKMTQSQLARKKKKYSL